MGDSLESRPCWRLAYRTVIRKLGPSAVLTVTTADPMGSSKAETAPELSQVGAGGLSIYSLCMTSHWREAALGSGSHLLRDNCFSQVQFPGS